MAAARRQSPLRRPRARVRNPKLQERDILATGGGPTPTPNLPTSSRETHRRRPVESRPRPERRALRSARSVTPCAATEFWRRTCTPLRRAARARRRRGRVRAGAARRGAAAAAGDGAPRRAVGRAHLRRPRRPRAHRAESDLRRRRAGRRVREHAGGVRGGAARAAAYGVIYWIVLNFATGFTGATSSRATTRPRASAASPPTSASSSRAIRSRRPSRRSPPSSPPRRPTSATSASPRCIH